MQPAQDRGHFVVCLHFTECQVYQFLGKPMLNFVNDGQCIVNALDVDRDAAAIHLLVVQEYRSLAGGQVAQHTAQFLLDPDVLFAIFV